jgi:hypothetical protein
MTAEADKELATVSHLCASILNSKRKGGVYDWYEEMMPVELLKMLQWWYRRLGWISKATNACSWSAISFITQLRTGHLP